MKRNITIHEDEIALKLEYEDRFKAKEIPDYRWDPKLKMWLYPKTFPHFQKIVEIFDGQLEGNEASRNAYIQAKAEWQTELDRIETAKTFHKDLLLSTDEDHTSQKFIEQFTTPYQHQSQSFHFIRHLGSGGLLLEQGTGKTKVAIDLMRWWKQQGESPALVVAPNSVKFNWGKELELHSDLSYVVLDGSNPKKRKLLKENHKDVYIINYEAISSLQKDLLEKDFAIQIYDESSKIKNRKAKRTKTAIKLSKTAKHKIIMSGTPVVKSPEDVFSQFQVIDPSLISRTWKQFADEYIIFNPYLNYIEGYRNLPKLQEKVEKKSIRFLKAQCLDLPPKVFQTLEVELSPEQQEVYDQLKETFIAELGDETIIASNTLTQLLRFTQITSGHLSLENEDGRIIRRFETDAKFSALKELLADELAGEKVIIWCRFIDDIQKIVDFYGEEAVAFYGATKSDERQQTIDQFNNDETIRYFVGQTGTGGMGINLTAASTAVYYSLSFSLEEYLQSQDRNHRIGQDRKCTYLHLCCKDTIDHSVMAILQEKKDFADIITGDNFRLNIRKILDGQLDFL